jgi:hypothetical protein
MGAAFPEKYKILKVTTVQHANTLTTMDYICTKNANKVWFIIQHDGAADDDMTFSFVEATEVAGTTTAAATATSRIWSDIDAGTSSDTLVAQTAAASLLVDTTTDVTALVVMEWDPRQHTAGYDCISLVTDAGHANNFVAVLAVVEERYAANQPPSAIID